MIVSARRGQQHCGPCSPAAIRTRLVSTTIAGMQSSEGTGMSLKCALRNPGLSST